MKKLSAILVIMTVVSIGSAQEVPGSKNILRVGLNGAFFGSGDVLGFGISSQYIHQFNDYLAVTPRITFSIANNLYSSSSQFKDFHQISSRGMSLSAKLTPFPKSFKRLKFDFGGLYQRFSKSWGRLESEDMYGIYSSESSNYLTDNHFGFLGSINLDLIDSEVYECGLRLELLTSLYKGYLECDGYQGGLYFGIRF